MKWNEIVVMSTHDQRKVNGTQEYGWHKMPNYSGSEFLIEKNLTLFVRMA